MKLEIVYESLCPDGVYRKGIDYVLYINSILLGIAIPSVSYKPESIFATASTYAATDGDDIVLNLAKRSELENLTLPTMWFVVSHEMRHLYQKSCGLISSDYKSSDELSVGLYNEQAEELDAHAWSCAMTSIFAGVRPNFPSSELTRDVYSRAEYILTPKMIRKSIGLSQIAFSQLLNIPLRTIEDWDSGNRLPKSYVVRMLAYNVFVS